MAFFTDNPPLDEPKFNEFVKQQELSFLRELAEEYNNTQGVKPLNRIDVERIGQDKLKLTISLWQRDIIPSRYRVFPYQINGESVELVEPYLSVLIFYSKVVDDSVLEIDEHDNAIEETNDIWMKPEDTYTYILMGYADDLLGFVIAASQLYFKSYDLTPEDRHALKGINRALTELALPVVQTKEDFIKVVAKLPILAIISLSLKIENYFGFHPSSGLGQYTLLVEEMYGRDL